MLKDKVIVVVGGNGLLGKEFVKEIQANNGIAISADIKNENTKSDFSVSVDICNEESVQSCIDVIEEKYNKIDAVINSAYPKNINYGRKFFDVELSDFNENVSNHVGSFFLVCKLFSKYFMCQGYGNIINISSIYGYIAPRFQIYDNTSMTTPIEYTASKSAIIALTQYLARYLKNKNIRVNSISPGGIFDNQPQEFVSKYSEYCTNKGMLAPKDLTGALIYLLSDGSKYIQGHNLIIDDGFSL